MYPLILKRRPKLTISAWGIVVFFFSCVLAYQVTCINRTNRAICVIQKLGGKVWLSNDVDEAGMVVSGPFLPGKSNRLSTVRNAMWLNVVCVDLRNTSISNDDLTILALFPRLKRVYLDNTSISDRALDLLERNKELKFIGLENTSVSSTAFAAFENKMPEVTTNRDFDSDSTFKILNDANAVETQMNLDIDP
jgi:hypothetical protein